ncbi:MAG TPA: hypothetical protein VG944_21220 [Fimbriimonas sp.]|nr:hypothetical protein [Fimbriimonas sp.]
MRIVDYQTGKELRDVSLLLNDEELEDLALYIRRLKSDSRVNCAHLTQVSGAHLEREFTVAREEPARQTA